MLLNRLGDIMGRKVDHHLRNLVSEGHRRASAASPREIGARQHLPREIGARRTARVPPPCVRTWLGLGLGVGLGLGLVFGFGLGFGFGLALGLG